MTNNNKKIGTLGATFIGISGILGGGLFAVQGEAIKLSGQFTPVAFILAGIVAVLTANSYLKLSLYYRDNGGTAVYLRKTFGKNIFTESINLVLWAAYIITISLYAHAFSSHTLALFGLDSTHIFLKHFFSTISILIPATLNLASLKTITRLESLAAIFKLSILFGIATAGLLFMIHTPDSRAVSSISSSRAATGIIVTTAFITIAFQGYELLSNIVADTKFPRRTLPRAFYFSVGLSTFLYVLITTFVVSSTSYLTMPDIKETVLAETTIPLLGQTGYVLVSLTALASTLAAITVTIYGIDKLGHELALEKELPSVLLQEENWESFSLRFFLYSGIAILIANVLDLSTTIFLASGLFLLVFSSINAAALQLSLLSGKRDPISLSGLLTTSTLFIILVIFTNLLYPHAAILIFDIVTISIIYRLLVAARRHISN